MKKVVLAILAVAVLAVAGCYEVKNSTVVNNYYGDSNSIVATEEKLVAEKDPNQYGTLTFRISLGEPTDTLSKKRGRQVQDLIPLISKAQANKVKYVDGYIYNAPDTEYYYHEFYISEYNQDNNIQIKVGNYYINASAHAIVNNFDYILFSGNQSIEIKKGPNKCTLALSLADNQPIIISLPENETVENCLNAEGEREGEDFYTVLCPSSNGSNRISGCVPINLDKLSIVHGDEFFTLYSDDIIDSIIFTETISLDEYEPEKVTSVEIELGLEENSLIAGTRNKVMTFKVKAIGNATITSFQFMLSGDKNDTDYASLSSEDIELGNTAFSSNPTTILVSPIEMIDKEEKTFVLKADIPLSATFGNPISFKLTKIGVNGEVEVKQTNPDFIISSNGDLDVSAIKPSSGIVLAGSTKSQFMTLCFLAKDESADIESFTIHVKDGDYCGEVEGNYKDTFTVIAYDTYNKKIIEASIPSTGEYTCNLLSGTFTAPEDKWVYLYVYAKMSTIDPEINDAPGTANADVKIGISNIVARGILSNRNVDITERNLLESNTMVLRNSELSIDGSSNYYSSFGAATKLTNGNICIYVSRPYADASGKNVLMYKMTYEVRTDTELSDPYIEDWNGNVISKGEWIVDEEHDTYVTSFYFDNPDVESGLEKEAIEIPRGLNTRLLYVWTTVAGATASSYLGTRQIGDYNCVPMDIAENIEGNIIWSDNYKQLSISNGEDNAVNAEQWYNGHLVSMNQSFYYISY